MSAMAVADVRALATDVVQRARELVRSADSRDPLLIAKSVMAQLDDDAGKSLLSMCLLVWVERELAAKDRPVAEHRPAVTPVRAATTPERVREWYARQTAIPVQIGDATKPLAECTAAELRHVAELRRMQADQLDRIARFMNLNNRRTVAQILPTEFWSLMRESA